jgi:hypothetical protein
VYKITPNAVARPYGQAGQGRFDCLADMGNNIIQNNNYFVKKKIKYFLQLTPNMENAAGVLNVCQ